MQNSNNITPQTQFDDLPELLTPKQIGLYLDIAVQTVYKYINNGTIKSRKLPGKGIIVEKSDFKRYIKPKQEENG